MIIVKHVDQNGVESVFLADGVQFVPEGTYGNKPRSIHDLGEGVSVHLTNGETQWFGFDKIGSPEYKNPSSKVYIMNEHGKTVATYTL